MFFDEHTNKYKIFYLFHNNPQVIANRLCESKQKIPHYYLTTDIEMDQIMEVRKNFNDKLQKG